LLAAATVVIAALAVLVPASPAAAFGERIDRYDIAIEVGKDSTLHVTETIDYDTGGLQKHGIFRYIPVRFHYDDKYDRVYPITNIHVTGSVGTPTKTKITDEGNNKVIRIGDPKKLISGKHQYAISYDVRGALNHFPDHDELYWNALGDRWDFPSDEVTVKVGFPVATLKLACFSGPPHSVLPCGDLAGEGTTTATFGDVEVNAFEALTIVAAIPPGSTTRVGPVLDERWAFQRAFAVTPGTVAGSAGLGVLALLLVVSLLWRTGRDRRAVAGGEEVIPMFGKDSGPVQYRPPEGLHPAQVGVLIDESADPLDVTASIVDLAVRGFISIETIPDKGLFSKADWRLTDLKKDTEELEPYERGVLTGLFRDADGDTQLMSDLKNHFYKDLKKVEDMLYNDCVRKGWFRRRPDRTRAMWLGLGVLAFLLGIGITVVVAAFTHAGLVPVPLILAGFVVLVAHRRMPARTAQGTAALRDVAGFREFIRTAETERMQFAEEEGIFAKYLPYAIVFGATKQWAKRFEGLGADSPAMRGMGWYVSPYPFNPIGFSDSMHDFTVNTAGTIVSTPPSTSGGSGFSGGGFSGGGGGGGGGGSW
jgi:uncharacterized membrane protein